MKSVFRLLPILAAGLVLIACEQPASVDAGASGEAAATAADADAWVAEVNAELDELGRETGAAAWVRANFITKDTAIIASKAREKSLAYSKQIIEESKRFDGIDVSDDAARSIQMVRFGTTLPAPSNADHRRELAEITTAMSGTYGAGKYCPDGKDNPDTCLDETALIRIMGTSRDPAELLDAWTGWRGISPPIKSDYIRFVELANEGTQELGYNDLGVFWKSRYELSSSEFEEETERLWQQVKPLYSELHCYVRDKLADHYGDDVVPRNSPIPAHLLGNMWAQEWGNIYDLMEPYPGVGGFDVTSALVEKGYDEEKMTRMAENFFVSLDLPNLPDTFYERSLLKKPRDRDVVCHASAWPLDGGDDVRIKQCIEINTDHFSTLHHELGHIYYYLMYKHLPNLYRSGAHPGFHEAIGDTLVLSMTPSYYQEIGLIDSYETNEQSLINEQFKSALDKIGFLPFGRLMDLWRWKVYSGEVSPDEYNAYWWKLREEYQGIVAPVERSEADFDPGAKFHIPANVSYTRYFLARILQFQFHKSLCEAAGHEGPLHGCSIYNNKDAGAKFGAMLALGQSQPWPDALEQATGSREMDGSAIIDYYQPLITWLKEQNKDSACGW